jgi:hypothetical protein
VATFVLTIEGAYRSVGWLLRLRPVRRPDDPDAVNGPMIHRLRGNRSPVGWLRVAVCGSNGHHLPHDRKRPLSW